MSSMQNKTVALYFSNRNHYSVLEVILKSLKALDCKVMLFLAREMSQTVYAAPDILIQQEISNKKVTLSKVFKSLNAADFVIIDQLYSFNELLSFTIYRLERPNMMLIHDCNSWFNPIAPKGFIQKIKHKMTQRVRRKVRYFAVAGENMFTYCTQDLALRNIALIPFRYADFNPDTDITNGEYQVGDPIRIAVPGMITSRRNYHELLDVITAADLKGKVELILLGRPEGHYGLAILERAERLKTEGHLIKYWKSFISNEVFDEAIRLAHILFSHFDTRFMTNNGQEEIYGISKETGISLLMYNKAKVGILPKAFSQMQKIKNQTITFQTLEDLKTILANIYTGKLDIREKKINAVRNASDMSLQHIVEQLNQAYQSQKN